jgi:hypothetical protein
LWGFRRLPPDTGIYRLITRAADFDRRSGELKAGAFIRRAAVDTDGLSVFYKCTPAQAAGQLRGVKLVVELRVDAVCLIQHTEIPGGHLKVIPDPPSWKTPRHAAIVGAPLGDEDLVLLNFVATRLKEIAVVVPHNN